MKDYRKIYERYYGVKIGRDEFGRKHEIHHIDGNHDNNDPLNLTEVTIQEHYDIHYSQGDYGACLMISAHMEISPEEKSLLASLANDRRVATGIHPFLGGEMQRETQQRRVNDGKHHWLGPENNAKRVLDGTHHFLSGEISRETQLRKVLDGSHPFLGPDSPTQVKWTCPHCQKSGKGKGNYTRYHGDNCRQKIRCEV